MATPQPGTDWMKGNTAFPTTQTAPYACGNTMYADQNTVNDYTEFQVKLKVPTNAVSFAIDAAYLTAEYPESLCNGSTPGYDDPAFILLDSMAFKGNIAIGGAHGRALSVKSGLLTKTAAMQLTGTGMDKLVANAPAGAATDWMTMEAPVTPGETITIRIIVLDQRDGVFDTQLLVDNFRWQVKTVCAPDTTIDGDGGADAGAPMCPDGGIMDAGGQ
jgi:acyl dehydratase